MAWNKLANSVRGTLDANINDAATTMGVTLYSGSASYPASIDADNPIYLTIHNAANILIHEIVKVTAVDGADVTTMVRGQRGTSAQSWAAGAVVSLNLHAQDISEMRAFVDSSGNYTGVNGVFSGNISAVDCTLTGQAKLAAGAVGAPSLYLSTDTTTGLYRSAANELAISISGTQRARFTPAGLTLTAGTVSAPALTLGDSGTGKYRPAGNQIGWAIAGTQRALLSSNGWDVTGTRVQVTNSGAGAQLNAYTYRDSASLSSIQLGSARGTLSSPANLQTGDTVGLINARPWQSGTTFSPGSGFLRFVATENHSATANGTKVQIYVTANGGTLVALGLEIDQDRKCTIPGSLAHTGSSVGFLNTAAATKQTVTGSRGSNAALASLLTALATYGLITDSTS